MAVIIKTILAFIFMLLLWIAPNIYTVNHTTRIEPTVTQSAPITSQPKTVSSTTQVPLVTTVPATQTMGPVDQPQHEHNYLATTTKPSCTTEGYTTYRCSCGNQYTGKYIEALGHQWGNWYTTKESTFLKEGSESRSCTQCKKTQSRQTNTRTIAGDTHIILQQPVDPDTYMKYPMEADFGEYYGNAVKLYDALMAHSDEELGLFFSNESYEEEYADWEQFKEIFEQTVLSNQASLVKRGFVIGSFKEGSGLTRIDMVPSDTFNLQQLCYDVCVEAGLSSGMSQLDAVTKINEWMRKNIVYESGAPDPITVLSTGKAQCDGYANVFGSLCTYVGVETRYISGCVGHNDGRNCISCHAWNQVKLGNDWYYIDVCWNDVDSKPNQWFLTQELWASRKVSVVAPCV